MGDVAQIVNLDEGWKEIEEHGLKVLEVNKREKTFTNLSTHSTTRIILTFTPANSFKYSTQNMLENEFRQSDRLFENDVKMRVYT
jgi:hypothetical protein